MDWMDSLIKQYGGYAVFILAAGWLGREVFTRMFSSADKAETKAEKWVQAYIEEIKTDREALSLHRKKLVDSIGELKAEVAGLRGDTSGMRTDLHKFDNRLISLETKYAELVSQYLTIEQKYIEIYKDVAILKGES